MPKALLPLPVLSVRHIKTRWARFKHSFLPPLPTNPSITLDNDEEEDSYWPEDDTDDREVDEVVVDRLWSEHPKLSVANSDWGGGSGLAKDSLPASGQAPGDTAPSPDFPVHSEFWTYYIPLMVVRWRLWPALNEFFSSRFSDDVSEKHYQQESWYIKKSLAIWASFFLVFNWILGCSLFIHHDQPVVLADKIFYFGVAPILTLPIPFMIVYNLPRYHSNFYQTILVMSTWSWSLYQVIFMYFCGFYDHRAARFSCGSKDFMDTFYYTAAIQTISLFGLRLKRFPALIGALGFLISSCVMIVPLRDAWGRNMVNFAVYHGFLIYLHYRQEHAERRLYNLRDQLRLQFKATQKAQVNERKTADSKRRLTSRVSPLSFLL